MKLKYLAGFIISVGLLGSTAIQAEDSGFLPSYEGLTFAPGEYGGKTIVAPGAAEKAANITKIMIDQPEIFIADDSKYKGMKPDDARALAEALRESIIQNMTVLTVVEEPGPDVLYMRLAISDVHLKKKKRNLLQFTPVGLALTAAKSLLVSDLTKKIDLVGATIEGESMNAGTGDYFGSLVIRLSPPKEKKSNEASWEAMLSRFDSMGKQMDCRFRNRIVPKSKQENCKILDSYKEQ